MFASGAFFCGQPASARSSREEALEVACGPDADGGNDAHAEERCTHALDVQGSTLHV